jgi:hypothetical protein
MHVVQSPVDDGCSPATSAVLAMQISGHGLTLLKAHGLTLLKAHGLTLLKVSTCNKRMV